MMVKRMDDLISREKAINTAHSMRKVCDTDNIDDYHDLMVAALKDLPSAEKYARWEYVDYGGIGNWHCSACRGICTIKFEHCPYCGAKMGDK